jgi:hypothetical protein
MSFLLFSATVPFDLVDVSKLFIFIFLKDVFDSNERQQFGDIK